jgi:hypothetical protein
MTSRKTTVLSPKFMITAAIANDLMRIEAVKQSIQTLPITPRVLATLRETARLFSTHYSTMIEGNRLTQQQVAQVIAKGQHFPGRERDQDEVRGYYAALDEVERLAKADSPVTESGANPAGAPTKHSSAKESTEESWDCVLKSPRHHTYAGEDEAAKADDCTRVDGERFADPGRPKHKDQRIWFRPPYRIHQSVFGFHKPGMRHGIGAKMVQSRFMLAVVAIRPFRHQKSP